MKQTLHGRRCAFWLFALALFASAVGAQEDPPGRVGRLADLQGPVSRWDPETGRWDEAVRNHPLTGGDRLSTGPGGRAELSIGSTVLRVGAGSELEVLRLDDERMVFQLHSGNLALRVRSRESAEQTEIVTAEVRLLPERAGHYRVGRVDDVTQAGVWRGDLRIDDPAGFVISTGQFTELTRGGPGTGASTLRRSFATLPADAFAGWVVAADQRAERTASSQHVSPEMTGADDLDRSGRWSQHPDYGAVWEPEAVAADWAPYRYGSWSWVEPWGWTWVDDAPWGFAPFHYGRWVYWRDRWAWAPGPRLARPVYAPALVGFVGGVSFAVGGARGRPPSGWVPLGPREAYSPWYRHGPRYNDRINTPPPYRWHDRPAGPPGRRDGVPIAYANQGVPRGVTVVPRDALQRPDSGAGMQPRPGPGPGRVRPQPLPDAPSAVATPPSGQRGERDRDGGRDRDRDVRGDRESRRSGYEPQMDNSGPPAGPRAGRFQRGFEQRTIPPAPNAPNAPTAPPAPLSPAPPATPAAQPVPAPPPMMAPAPMPRPPRQGSELERGPGRRPSADAGEPAPERKQRPERPSMRDRESSR